MFQVQDPDQLLQDARVSDAVVLACSVCELFLTKAAADRESGISDAGFGTPRSQALSSASFMTDVAAVPLIAMFTFQPDCLLHAVRTSLKAAGVRALRMTTCDSSSQIRTKAVILSGSSPSCTLPSPNCMSHGVGMVECMMALPSFADHVAKDSGLGPSTTLSLVPDFGTLQVLPYHPTHANVYGFLCDNKASDATGGRQLSDVCPRWCLQRSVEALSDLGFRVAVGVEIEFVLCREQENGGWQPVDNNLWCSASAMDQPQVADFMDDVEQMLQQQGVEVEQMHAESCHGQFEVVLRHCNCPIKMADSILTTRQTLQAVASRHAMRVLLGPKPSANEAGNGMHIHISIHSESLYMPDVESFFMAGILQHLPGLVAITTPSEESFHRLQPGCWAGAYCCWGVDNKEAALRLCDGHFELKSVDNSCNPYLALAAIISSGINGVQWQIRLPPPIRGDPAADSTKPGRLPAHLSAALDLLEQDQVLVNTLGPRLARAYTAVKREESARGD